MKIKLIMNVILLTFILTSHDDSNTSSLVEGNYLSSFFHTNTVVNINAGNDKDYRIKCNYVDSSVYPNLYQVPTKGLFSFSIQSMKTNLNLLIIKYQSSLFY